LRVGALLIGLVLGTAPALADEVCDPLAIELVTTPQRTPGYLSLVATQKLQASLPEAADAILLGDSLFAGWRTDLPKTFPATRIYDFAVGGDRVPNVLWRMENTDIARLKPSALALLIGTNDLAAGTPPCAVAKGIGLIVSRLRANWPEAPVFVLTIPPRGPDFREIDDVRLEVNRAITELGKSDPSVHPVLIDDVAFTCGQYAAPKPTSGRLVCNNYVDDNLHFSTEGYVELGRILKEASTSAVGKSLFN
jgi:lysophospholipase L1-like esterase